MCGGEKTHQEGNFITWKGRARGQELCGATKLGRGEREGLKTVRPVMKQRSQRKRVRGNFRATGKYETPKSRIKLPMKKGKNGKGSGKPS